MKRLIIGIVVGMFVGVLDVIPMVLQKLTWDANISAFSMWVIICVFIATTEYKIVSGIKGIIIAFSVLFPSAVLIGWKEPFSLIPICIITIILGFLSGVIIEMLKKKI